MRQILAIVLGLLSLAGCNARTWTQPIDPPRPTPTPTPVPPTPTPNPGPIKPTPPAPGAVPYAQVRLVDSATSIEALYKITGGGPDSDSAHRDGTHLLRWRSMNEAGDARTLEVHVSASGSVLGHALLVESRPPSPVSWSASNECPGGVCALPPRRR